MDGENDVLDAEPVEAEGEPEAVETDEAEEGEEVEG